MEKLGDLKSNGFIPQVDKGYYSMRIRMAGGQLKANQLKRIYEIAKKFGRGTVHLTSRQSLEIPFIRFEDIEMVKLELAKSKLEPAAAGPRVRTITACQGNVICKSGLINTTLLAEEIDKKYYGMPAKHKFKIGITGCRNNCLKAEENDLGIKGGMEPTWVSEKCTYCGACMKICRTKAILVDKSKKTLERIEDNCNQCGRCVKTCPTKAWEGTGGFIVYFGGLFGNRITTAKQLLPLLKTKEELFKIIDKTLDFFNEYANNGERFANMLDRVGWDKFEEYILKK